MNLAIDLKLGLGWMLKSFIGYPDRIGVLL